MCRHLLYNSHSTWYTFPIPIAYYISRYGYKISLVTALAVCSAGAAFFIPAYYAGSYPLALTAIFIISIGVTLVNVAANPLAALLGDPSGSHMRVNFVQLFSRIGYAATPLVATKLIYGSAGSIHFHIPYLLLGTGTLIFAIFILFSAIPALKPEALKGFSFIAIVKESRKYPQLFWGALTMFFYVGAEACTAGFFISYLRDVSHLDAEEAAKFLTYYYIASTIVCVAGIYLLQYVSPGKLVAWFGGGMITMYLLAIVTNTSFNQWYLIGMGAFISIIFPSVFSLSIEGIGNFTEKGSALVNISIVGGAIFPPIQGFIADWKGVQVSYIIPCICFVLIVLYGIFCHRHSLLNEQLVNGNEEQLKTSV